MEGCPSKLTTWRKRGWGGVWKKLIFKNILSLFAKSLPYRHPHAMFSLSRTSLTSFALREERFVKKKQSINHHPAQTIASQRTCWFVECKWFSIVPCSILQLPTSVFCLNQEMFSRPGSPDGKKYIAKGKGLGWDILKAPSVLIMFFL